MSKQTEPMMIQGDREIFTEDLEHIQLVVKRFPSLSRKEIVHTLCETLDWLTPAGRPKVNACTKLLQRLEAQGRIRLPAKREQYSHRTHTGVSTLVLSSRTAAQPLLNLSLKALGPVRLVPVSDSADQALWNEYVERYHYLGYKRPFGYRQRYFIETESQRLGCVLLSGAAKALNVRDHWIGWDARQRMKNLPWVLNNNRFLVFPWVQVPNLASHVLGQLARRVGDDWRQRWGYRPVLLETFVDPQRFPGSCYRAAGWKLLGQTTGEGLIRAGKAYRTRAKLMFVKPLQADFRGLLCADQLNGRSEP